MTTVALLNEASDAVVAKAMTVFVHQHLAQAEQVLISRQLDREDYLRAFARASVLREVASQLDKTYREAFET